MSPPKRPPPPRPSAMSRAPSFAPGPRKSVAPLAPLASRMPPSPLPNVAPYEASSLEDGPTVTSFDPFAAEAHANLHTDELEAPTFDDPTELMEELEDDEPTHLPRNDHDSFRSAPPPRPAAGRSVAPAPRPSTAPSAPPPAARPSVAPARPSFPSPRTHGHTPDPRAAAARLSSPPAARGSVPPEANPFLAVTGPMQAVRPSQAPPRFDDVNTAFGGGANMAPDFGALEARASRPEWSKQLGEAALPPQRARAHSIDLGEGVIVETLAGFEPERHTSASEVSDAWRPETQEVHEKPAMRLESVHPPTHGAPMHPGYPPMQSAYPPAPRVPQGMQLPGAMRPQAPTLDLRAEAARANRGRVRVAYVVAGLAILLLLVAILSAVLVIL